MTSPKFPLGVPLMDADHARIEALFEQVNTIADDALPAFSDMIERELARHFAAEEELMREHQAPVLECHIAQHRMLLGRVAEDAARAAGDAAALRLHLCRDVAELVMSHVMSVDQVTARFLGGSLDPQSVGALRLPEESVQ